MCLSLLFVLFFSLLRSFSSSSISTGQVASQQQFTQMDNSLKNKKVNTSYSSANTSTTTSESEKLDKVISDLRNLGQRYLSVKAYKDAAQCYLALLQLHEGLPGPQMATCRRRYGLTLAECHCRMGDTEEGIARFSDVIDESPVFLDDINNNNDNDREQEILRLSVAKSLCMRGLSFKKLGLLKYSYLDITLAIEYNPADTKLFEELDVLLRDGKNEGLDEQEEDSTAANTTRMEQQIYVENLQEKYPRPVMSMRQINLLARRKVASSSSSSSMTGTSLSPLSTGSSPLGGLGGIGSLLGSMGSGGGLGGIMKLLPMVGGMIGMSAESIQNTSEIIAALGNVFSSLTDAYKFITKNCGSILIALAVLFLMYSSNC